MSAFPLPASASGTGHVSHLGNGTYSLDFTITPTDGEWTVGHSRAGEGREQLVAVRRHERLGASHGEGRGAGQRSVTTSQFTVTGGTGRFADATGTMTSVVVSEVLTIAGGFATDSQEGTITGTISY